MLRVGTAVCFLLALALPAACGGDEFTSDKPPPPCEQDPWSCPAGQTCWPVDTGKGFKCLNAGPAKEGESCQLYKGSPTCASGLICSIGDVCKRFCSNEDPNRKCSGTDICAPLQIQGVGSIQACGTP